VLRGNFQNVKRWADYTEYGKPCLQCGSEFAGHTPRAVLFEAKKRTRSHQKISAIVQLHLQVSFKNVQTNLSERLIQYKTWYKYDSVTLGLKFNICIIISFPFCRSISSILFIPNLLIFQLDSGTKNSCLTLVFLFLSNVRLQLLKSNFHNLRIFVISFTSKLYSTPYLSIHYPRPSIFRKIQIYI